MEFGQGRPHTGWLMTPLVSIQNRVVTRSQILPIVLNFAVLLKLHRIVTGILPRARWPCVLLFWSTNMLKSPCGGLQTTAPGDFANQRCLSTWDVATFLLRFCRIFFYFCLNPWRHHWSRTVVLINSMKGYPEDLLVVVFFVYVFLDVLKFFPLTWQPTGYMQLFMWAIQGKAIHCQMCEKPSKKTENIFSEYEKSHRGFFSLCTYWKLPILYEIDNCQFFLWNK